MEGPRDVLFTKCKSHRYCKPSHKSLEGVLTLSFVLFSSPTMLFSTPFKPLCSAFWNIPWTVPLKPGSLRRLLASLSDSLGHRLHRAGLCERCSFTHQKTNSHSLTIHGPPRFFPSSPPDSSPPENPGIGSASIPRSWWSP